MIYFDSSLEVVYYFFDTFVDTKEDLQGKNNTLFSILKWII